MHRQSPVGPRTSYYEMPYGANRETELSPRSSGSEWRSRGIGRMPWPQSPPQWQSSPVGRNCGPSPVFWNSSRSPYGPGMHSPEWSPRPQRGSNRRQKSSVHSPQPSMYQSPPPRYVRGPARRRESGASQLYKPSMVEDPWAELEPLHSPHRVDERPAKDQREHGLSG